MFSGRSKKSATADLDGLVDDESARRIKAQIAEEEKDFVILPENWETIKLWMRIRHLWNYGAMGGVFCLNWPAVKAKIELIESRSEMRFSLDVIEGIEIMEETALVELNRRD